MYYKLTMKDKRVVFVPAKELHEQLFGKKKAKNANAYWAPSFRPRLTQIQIVYPEAKDWSMEYKVVDWEWAIKQVCGFPAKLTPPFQGSGVCNGVDINV